MPERRACGLHGALRWTRSYRLHLAEKDGPVLAAAGNLTLPYCASAGDLPLSSASGSRLPSSEASRLRLPLVFASARSAGCHRHPVSKIGCGISDPIDLLTQVGADLVAMLIAHA